MASISSLSGSTNNAMSSLRGYGGLASGLDRDELIAGMTSGTQTKITKQEQAKTKLEWQQQAYRDISDKMIAFANKYTSTMSSTTNLFSEALWGAASTMVKGINSKFISVAGANRTAAANVSILGVKQMAKNAKVMSDNYVSDRKLSTGAVDTGDVDISTLAGKNLDFTVGGKYYSVGLPYGTGEPFGSMQEAADAFNEAMKKVEITQTGGAKKQTLFDSVEVGVSDDGKSFVLKSKGNAVTLTGGSALEAMGFKEQVDEAKANKRVGLDIAGNTGTAAGKEATLKETQSFAQRMGDKSLTFSYNGSTKTIQMPSQKEIEDAINSGKDGLEFLAEKMQESLDAAFGKGRVQAKVEEDSAGGDRRLTFKTTTPDGNSDDSSTLAITEGSESIMSSYGGLGITSGESNRLNLNTSLKNSGLNFGEKTADGKYELEINGKKIEFTEDESLATIMDRINNADAGVKISYLSMADKFSLEATDSGASGVLKLSGSGAKALFGEEIDSANPTAAGKNTVTLGQDAIIAVKYAGSDEAIELTRGDNSFSIDGLDVTIKGEFGYKLGADGKTKELDETTEAVTFETNVESEKIVKAVSDMVKEYNEILELVNTQLSTRPDRDYFPLTDEQKKEMSESEIKLWEEKAKEGLIRNDNDISIMLTSLRQALYQKPAGSKYALYDFGIETVSGLADKAIQGTLTIDETKLRQMITTDPESLRQLFTDSADGLAAKMKTAIDKAAKTSSGSPGTLVQLAGVSGYGTDKNNTITNQINSINEKLKQLNSQ